MSWARLDDRFDDNRKIKRAWRRCRASVGLYAMALAYTSRHNLDGEVDAMWLEERMADAQERSETVEVLVSEGLFEERGGGVYVIHDYLDYNRSSEQRAALAKARTAAGKTGAKAKQVASRLSKQTAKQKLEQTVSKGMGGDGMGKSPRRGVNPDQPPSSLVPGLRGAAEQSLAVLLAVQAERGGSVPTLRGVGLAVARFPDRDHLGVAHDLEHWALAGRGANRAVKDWARTFATFLEGSTPGAPSRSANGRPLGREALMERHG